MVINGCANSGRRTQKLAVSHDRINGINGFNGINGINGFWCVDINLGNFKVTLIIGL